MNYPIKLLTQSLNPIMWMGPKPLDKVGDVAQTK